MIKRGITGVVVIIALVAGCSGGGDPDKRASGPAGGDGSTAAPQTSSTPGAPEKRETPGRPKEASEADARGAAAATAYFFQMLGHSFMTRDPRHVEGLYEPGCTMCKAYVTALNKARSKKQTVKGGEIIVESARARGAAGGKARVEALVHVNAARISDAKGEPVSNEPAADVRFDVRLVRDGDRWVVAKMLPRR